VRRKFNHCDAKDAMKSAGVSFDKDFHAQSRSAVDMLLAWAKATRYQKRRDAPGSRARMYYQLLQRKKGC